MTADFSFSQMTQDRFVPWLDQVANGWQCRPIKYSVAINRQSLDENTQANYKIRYIDIGSVDSDGNIISIEEFEFENAPSRARRIVKSGDTLISTVRTYLRAIAFCEEASSNLICSTGFAVLRPPANIEPKFLFYWVRSTYFIEEIVSRSTGVSYPAINASEIGSLPFPVISKAEQRRITAFLDHKTAEIDELIALKERQVALLRQRRQVLISHAVTRGLDSQAPMRDSGIAWLGEVPEHWTICQLIFRYNIQLGKMLDTNRVTGTKLAPYLRNVDVQWDYINTAELPQMDFSSDDRRRFNLQKGDLLICEGGEVGRTAIWQDDLTECYYQKALHRARPIFSSDIPRFLFYVMVAAAYRGVFIAEGNPNTIDHLTAEKLGKHKLPFPPEQEQRAIVEHLDRETAHIDGIVATIEAQVERLRIYRQALITAAVTGKIDVRNTIGAVEQAAGTATSDAEHTSETAQS